MTNTSTKPATPTAINRLREQVKARRPWQLLIVGIGAENKAAVSPATIDALTRLFEYLPGLPSVTLQTANGDLHVSRDFPSGEMQIIDSLIASVFQNDPHVTGIVSPATNGKAAHVATADKPSFLRAKAERSDSMPDA